MSVYEYVAYKSPPLPQVNTFLIHHHSSLSSHLKISKTATITLNTPLPHQSTTIPLLLNQSTLSSITMFSRQSQTSDRRPSVMSSTESSRSSIDSVVEYKNTARITETQIPAKQDKSQKFKTLKSILTGDVHQHNARFAIDRAIMAGQPPAPESTKSSIKSSSKSSTLKSILTGEVHNKYDARRRIADAL